MRVSSSCLVGTFDEKTFQTFCPDEKNTTGPLRIGVSPFGNACVPLIGTYMEQYDPVVPFVLVQAEFAPEKVPPIVAAALAGFDDVSLFVQCHGVCPNNPCQHFTCDNLNELSVVLHPFFFPNVSFDSGNLFKKIQVGVFEPRNVAEVHQNSRDVAGSGLKFGELSERDCVMHDGAYSPANCQLRRLYGEIYSFWVVAGDKETGRAVASFHVICGSYEMETRMREIASKASEISELLTLDPCLATVIKRMCTLKK